MERTLAVIKTDGVQRKLVGEVIRRFEMSGLKIAGIKLLKPSKELVAQNYPDSDEWYRRVGERSINTFKEMGVSIKGKFGTEDPIAIGKAIKGWIIRFMTSGKVVAMVLEGNRAVDNVRRIVGETDPIKAMPGTIRGDFSIDTVAFGNANNRPITNVVHASGSTEEAKKEIALWFKESEIFEYKTDSDEVFCKEW